jgi:hypothetical protein
MDNKDNGQAIRVLMDRGDLSLLSNEERKELYVSVCERLGLDPLFAPLNYLKLQGKLVLYLTRTATDQLAKLHGLSREIIDGPRVVDIDGTRMLYAVCRVRLPSGREECAVATLPVVDPINALMKLETKAKRRATLAILGLAVLDDEKDDRDPGEDSQPASTPSAKHGAAENKKMPAKSSSLPLELAAYAKDVSEIDAAEKAVEVWLRHREQISKLADEHKQAAWVAIGARLDTLGVKSGGKWLVAAIAKHEAESVRVREPAPEEESSLESSVQEAIDQLSSSFAQQKVDPNFVAVKLADFWITTKSGVEARDGDLYGVLESIAKRYAAKRQFSAAVEELESLAGKDAEKKALSADLEEPARVAGENPDRSQQEKVDTEQPVPGLSSEPKQASSQQLDSEPAATVAEASSDEEKPSEQKASSEKLASAPASPGVQGKSSAPDPRIQALRLDLNKAVVELRSKSAASAVWLHHAKILPSTLKGEGYKIVEKAIRVIEPSIEADAIVDLIKEEKASPLEKAKERDFCGPVDLDFWRQHLGASDRDGSVAGSFSKRSEKLLLSHGKAGAKLYLDAAVARIIELRGCTEKEALTLIGDVSKSNEKRRAS